MMRVLLHEGAVRDVREIVKQLAEDSAKAVEQFYEEFEVAAALVAKHPEAGHPCQRFRRWNFRKFPYHLIYKVLSERGEVWIMVVRHDRRHPAYGMKRRGADPWLL